jgi:galactoside O-acetyltransferase
VNEQRPPADGRYLIPAHTPEFDAFHRNVQRALRLSARLSALTIDDAFAIRELFAELIGKPVDESFSLFPPFTADYGLNITVGVRVFVNQECMFLGHGAIDIGDRVLIGPRVSLITAGHPFDPEQRRTSIDAEPITVGPDVWIGANATVVPGVTIGHDSVVAAAAVVTRDVPPRTLFGGNPAKVIREL